MTLDGRTDKQNERTRTEIGDAGRSGTLVLNAGVERTYKDVQDLDLDSQTDKLKLFFKLKK